MSELRAARTTPASARRIGAISLIAAVVGLVVVIVAVAVDAEGFGGGLVLGSGIGMIGAGMYLNGYTNGLRSRTGHAGWLPSRDAGGDARQ